MNAARRRYRRNYLRNHPEKQPGFYRFTGAVQRVIKVRQDPASQARIHELIAARKIAAYERLDGQIGEIGVPRKAGNGGRVFRAKGNTRAVA